MNIGALITKRLEEGGFKQSAIAAQFVERARIRGVERTAATAESHVSRLKANDRTAVQFFFADPNAANDLMEIMNVPDGERAAFIDAASMVLTPEERPLRLVVDLTTGPQDQGFVAACEQAERALLDGAVARVALVMTDAQHEYLLRKYQDDPRLVVERVRAASAGEPTARSLAGTTAVVASTWYFHDLSRWIAIRWPARGEATLPVEPADALDALRAGRSLPPVSSMADKRDLAALGPDAKAVAPPKDVCPDALAVRKLIVSLLRGEPLSKSSSLPSPAVRLSWALHFGVRAAATSEEWVEHLVRHARQTGVSEVVRGPLAEQLSLVERGAKTPRVVVEGTQVYVINAEPAWLPSLRRLPGLQVREVARKVSALARLRAELSKSSAQGLLDDPHLGRMVDTLSAEGFDRAELSFFAACLLANDATGVTDAPRMRAWIEPLRAILAGDPPEAGIRVPRGIRDPRSGRFERIALRRSSPPRPRGENGEAVLVAGTLAATEIRVTRRDTLLVCSPSTESGRAYLPKGLRFDDDLAAYEAFERWRRQARADEPSEIWEFQPVMLDAEFWCEMDKRLALHWLALRRAVARADAVTLHDGMGVIEMGSKIVAEVSAYEVPSCPRKGSFLAELLLPVYGVTDRKYRVPSDHMLQSAGTQEYLDRTRGHIPHALHLASERVRIIITFRFTPWDLSATRDDSVN